jgi:hypothetical protein
MGTSEPCTMTDTKLKRIAWLSARDPHKRFDCLMHLFNEESLAGCFHELDGRKAVGNGWSRQSGLWTGTERQSQRAGDPDEAHGVSAGTSTASTHSQRG